MSTEGQIQTNIKAEEYIPGYLSTNRDFDPQTASFFYESRDCAARQGKISSSSQYVIPKVEVPNESSRRVLIHQENPAPPQRVPSKEYLAAQRQYQQNLLMRQQYLLSQGALSSDQKPYFIMRGTAPPQIVGKSTHPGLSVPNRCAARPTVYPQPVAPSNVQYSMVIPPQALAAQNSAGPQRIPPPPPQVIVHPQYPASQQLYGVHRIPIQSGVQYSNMPMVHYMPYQGDFEPQAYITPQGQVHHMSPQSTIMYAQDERPVAVQQVPLGYPTVPMDYTSGQPVIFDGNPGFQSAFIRENSNIGQEFMGERKTKSKRGKNDDEEESDTATAKKRRIVKRSKLENFAEGDQQDGISADGPPPPLTHGELVKQKKKNMAFPKGTFLVRYADLDSDEYAGHIWLVDNHQLLQKYTYDGLDASNVKVFSRTERYSGWLCTCPWLYHPLSDVKGTLGNMEKVSITNYPTREELFARREEERLKVPQEPESTEEPQESVHSDVEHSGDEQDVDVNEKEKVDDLPLFKTEPVETSSEN